MADPKYENLPGIAYDQPDVYETADLPEADQPEPYEEEENECIEQLHLSVKDSFNKFKGKFLTGTVDFSDRLSRKTRIGAGEWELAAEGEPESVLERYNRLRCEFSELLEQVTEQQNKATESEKDEFSKLASQINTTKKLLEELKLEEGEQIDPKAEKLKEYLASGKKKQGEVVTAHLKLKPDVNLAQTTRIAQLEHRLHKLEQAAGVRDEEAFRRLQTVTGKATLCGAAASLAAAAALLRPAELAAAEARAQQLLASVDALKHAGKPDPELNEKVNELHKLLKQIEGISHSEILERMEALEALHNQASNFGKSLTELETLQSTIASGVQNNKELLQGVQEVFAHNIDSLQKEIKKLDERIGKLSTA
ncbi:dynactin subunit 2 isoform X2 [Pectinophora gossypiella]|uniref:dynactin subunit 2 isoform X2 n=1 Tax=Pectinophora gossypiella TaxID=13191 RepID=UPI00214DFB5A|nr:dynactin subunit 2 isoform X2 [Pectinophora gossypiella]